MKQTNKQELPISKVIPDPDQPRQEFIPAEMDRLVASIKREGIRNPLIVEKLASGKYLIVDGERRWRSAKKLGLKTVPVRIEEEMTEMERTILRFHLQEQHANWTPFDKSVAIKALMASQEMDSEQVGEALGLPKSSVTTYLLLQDLSTRTKNVVSELKLPWTLLSEIALTVKRAKTDSASVKGKLEQALLQKVIDKKLTKQSEFTKLRSAMHTTENPDKMIEKIISNPNYSYGEALLEAGLYEKQQLNYLRNQASWLASLTDSIVAHGLSKHANESHVRVVERLHKSLGKFLVGTGYVMPKE